MALGASHNTLTPAIGKNPYATGSVPASCRSGFQGASSMAEHRSRDKAAQNRPMPSGSQRQPSNPPQRDRADDRRRDPDHDKFDNDANHAYDEASNPGPTSD